MPGDFLGLLAQNIFAAYFLDTPIRKLIFGCNVMLFLCTFFDMAIYSGFYTSASAPACSMCWAIARSATSAAGLAGCLWQRSPLRSALRL